MDSGVWATATANPRLIHGSYIDAAVECSNAVECDALSRRAKRDKGELC
jgi:hypothetical protein